MDDIGWLELEPTAYYDGPAVDNETLSAEQINDYVERQLRLQEAMACHLQAIDDLLWNAGYRRPAGLTIELLLDRLLEMDIPLQPERLSRQFNRTNYSDKKTDQNLTRYAQLFDALYALGFSDLKRRIHRLRPQ